MRSSSDRSLCLALCVIAALAQQCFCQQTLTANGDLALTGLDASSLQASGSQASRTLRFELCNGFANQRIALVFGILYAHILGRSAVLPYALMNGAQTADEWNLGDISGLAPLSELYDVEVRKCAT